jgi:hypothetical protein
MTEATARAIRSSHVAPFSKRSLDERSDIRDFLISIEPRMSRRSCRLLACSILMVGQRHGGGLRIDSDVIPRCAIAHRGYATWRRPGIHTPDRGYGFRARVEPVIGPRFARDGIAGRVLRDL